MTEEGFEKMYEEYFPKMYNYVFYRILSREDTEDIVSDVFFKVAKHAESFEPQKASFGTWIMKIAKNTLTDYYRKKKPTVFLEDTELESIADSHDPIESVISEERKVIFQALTQLKEKERLVIYYKFFEDYNNRQIAMLLGMNESTVGTVLQRTLKKLQIKPLEELWHT